MKNREKRLERAAAIGEKLWRLQKMRLSSAEGELLALRAAEAAAFEALAQGEPSLVLAYIDDLAAKRFEAEKALLEAQESARDHGRRVKLTRKLQKAAERLS
ncbi:hypothetical protein WOC76_06900 [Methylocystis sp. IM3]|uniref:hypothetical protein n=1 Tax=unclassified Methylocystis TaxID=2625913 RepID=UPI0030FA245B